MANNNMIQGKWYVTIALTGEVVRGPFETDKEASLVRTQLENIMANLPVQQHDLWVTKWDKKEPVAIETAEWYASTNQEHFTTGPFPSREGAIHEMLAEDETRFWTGRGVRLTMEDLVDVDLDNLEERASEKGFDIVGDYIDGWGFSGVKNKESCQKVIKWTVIKILRDHGACDPSCYRVVDVEEYKGVEVESKTDGNS